MDATYIKHVCLTGQPFVLSGIFLPKMWEGGGDAAFCNADSHHHPTALLRDVFQRASIMLTRTLVSSNWPIDWPIPNRAGERLELGIVVFQDTKQLIYEKTCKILENDCCGYLYSLKINLVN